MITSKNSRIVCRAESRRHAIHERGARHEQDPVPASARDSSLRMPAAARQAQPGPVVPGPRAVAPGTAHREIKEEKLAKGAEDSGQAADVRVE